MTVRRMTRIPRKWRKGQRARGRILLLRFFLRVGRLLSEGLRMQLAREIFDGGDNAGRRAIHGVADYGVTAIANGMNNLPTRECGEFFHFAGGVPGLRFRKHKKIRL